MNHTYMNYSDEQVAGLNGNLVARLDRAITLCGFRVDIMSGLRSVQQNIESGGDPDSSHLLGIAADLRMPIGRQERDTLIWALGRSGFKRVGIYDKIIHVDIDEIKPQDVIWFQ